MKIDGRLNILIAEDDDGHARLIRLGLEEAGLRNPVVRFKDGAEAWDFISCKRSPCLQAESRYLLLLDLRMPNMGGIELLRLLKASPDIRNVQVILVSTTDDPADMDICRKLGCSDFLSKPVNVGLLAGLIKS
ncbi:MAG: response regulator [Elusimicrobia bacterium]|nr:response regulator [Elusimicrobiota bacterium]